MALVLTEWLLLGAAVVLVGANALFVAAEFGFLTVDRMAVDRAADAGDRRAERLRSALGSLSTQLSGSQLGITVSSLVVGFLAEPSLAALLRPALVASGLGAEASVGVSFALALFVATCVQMVLGELVPKNLAIAKPLGVAQAVATFQCGFTATTRPLVAVLNGAANAVVRLLGIEPQEELRSSRSPRGAEFAGPALRAGGSAA